MTTLQRRRTVGEILCDSLALFAAHPGTFLVIGLAVVAPVDLIVLGIGLGELGSGYEETPSQGETLVEIGAAAFVTMPLMTAMVIVAALQAGDGEGPSARGAIQAGLDVFAPLLLVILMYAAAVITGVLALVVPGIILWVRLAFFAQAVVVDGDRGIGALRRSWRLTARSFWRTLGIIFVIQLPVAVVGGLLHALFTAGAQAADAQALVLAGTIIAEVLTGPLVAIAMTLLFGDLRERTAQPA